jgi:hypothetical protein
VDPNRVTHIHTQKYFTRIEVCDSGKHSSHNSGSVKYIKNVCLLFKDTTEAYPSGALESAGSHIPSHINTTRVEVSNSDKHSSLYSRRARQVTML